MIHGTRKSIATGCTCNLCTLVQAQLRDPQPAPMSVPTREAREHLHALVAAGWSINALATHLGYGSSTLYAIRAGKWLFTSRYIAEDILSVPVGQVAA